MLSLAKPHSPVPLTALCDRAGVPELAAWVEQLASRLGERLKQVSLYGSRARGEHQTRSDIDLLLVLDPLDRSGRDIVHALAVEWELEHNLDLSTRLTSSADYQRLSRGSDPFWRHFTRDQKQLWPTTSTNA